MAEALRANIDWKLEISLQCGQFDPKFQVEGVASRQTDTFLATRLPCIQCSAIKTTTWPRNVTSVSTQSELLQSATYFYSEIQDSSTCLGSRHEHLLTMLKSWENNGWWECNVELQICIHMLPPPSEKIIFSCHRCSPVMVRLHCWHCLVV